MKLLWCHEVDPSAFSDVQAPGGEDRRDLQVTAARACTPGNTPTRDGRASRGTLRQQELRA